MPVDVAPEVLALIDGLLAELRLEVDGVRIAERIRDGFEVAILGRPNVGKSTLLNALAGREAAITSELAGTTRDVIEVRMDLSGLAVTLLDTAGIRQTDDRVESIGIARAVSRARMADLRVFLTDEEGMPDGIDPLPDDIIVRAKADFSGAGLGVSGKTGAGLNNLMALIGERLSDRVAATGTITRERHRIAVVRAIGGLETARLEVSKRTGRSEVAAHELRIATRALDALVGRVDVESLLGEIFASFCIGK